MTTQRPARFEAYPTDRFIEIAKAWIDHPWPITTEEAKDIYESIGYRPCVPDPSLFASDLSKDGEPDSYYTQHDGYINAVNITVTRRGEKGTERHNADKIEKIYKQYCNAIDALLSKRLTRRQQQDSATEWFIDSNVNIRVGNPGHRVTFSISSPTMTQLRREEQEMGLASYDEILEDD